MISVESDIAKLAAHAQTCSWLRGYGAVSELIKQTNARSILEIGVAYGYHAIHLLDTCPGIDYIGLDPYLANYDPDDQFSADVGALFPNEPVGVEEANEAMDRLYIAVSNTLKRKSHTANVLRCDLITYTLQNREKKFDVIYIDGNHTEDYVFADTLLALLHLSKNGVICGDDIERNSVQTGLAKVTKILKLVPKLYQHKNGKLLWVLGQNFS
jgi:predicted O-methyltransferase YrrM